MGAEIMNGTATVLVDDVRITESSTSSLSVTNFPPSSQGKSKKIEWTDSDIIPKPSSEWQETAIKCVLKVLNLPLNWDSYGSPPPTKKAMGSAIKLLQSIDLENFQVPNVVPVSGGGIQIEWTIEDRELELEFLPDGSIEFLKCENGEPFEEGKIESPFYAEINLRHRMLFLINWLSSKRNPKNYRR